MANKEKLLASAQKFLSKGQIPKAIGEYQKLVEAFPKDIRNRQKLAELLSRDKRNEDALSEYEAVAKHYTETGFYLKSIAVFKQMQKIEPSRVDIYHRLAELNEKQGLVGNALTEYRNLVAFYEKNEMHDEAVDVLEKMASLDPDNLNFAAKIAECLMASGRSDEAFEKFQAIIEPLSEKGEHLKVVKLYERFLDICPEKGTSRLPLAQALLKSGAADKAIQVLKGLLKHSPEDPDISRALTDAYVANQDFAKARLTLKHLLKQNSNDFDLREYYARICIDAGEVEFARDSLEEWKDAFFHAERVSALKGFYEELKELLPGDSIVSGTLSVIYEAVGDTAKLDEIVDSADVSAGSDAVADVGLVDGAIDDVETLDMVGEEATSDIEVPPLEADKPRGEKPAPGLELELDLDLDLDLDLEAPGTPVEDVIPSLEAGIGPLLEQEATQASEVDEDVEIELDLDDLDELDLDFDEEPATDEDAAAAAEQVIIADEETEATEGLVSEDDEFGAEFEIAVEMPDVEEIDDFSAEQAAVEDEETEATEDLVSEDDEFEAEFEIAAEMPDAEEVDGFVAEEQELSADDIELDLDDSVFQAELETLDDVAELETIDTVEGIEGLAELAVEDVSAQIEGTKPQEDVEGFGELEAVEEFETLEDVEELGVVEEFEILEDVGVFGEVEELVALDEVEELEELEELEEIEELEVLEYIEELEEIEELEALDEDVQADGVDFAAALNVDAELEEAEFYLQQGLYDDAERVVQTLMEYRSELPVLQAKMDEIHQSRQAAETESASTDFVDIMSDLQDDDLLDATDFLDSFGAVAQEGDDLSQRLVSELDSADTESHYNLGIAYKEMGLYDDAIAEFEKAAIDPARNLDCTTLTGQCHMEAGDVDAAMAAFRNGLTHKGLTEEGRMTLNFEVGMLHQMNGQLLEALEAFQLVAEKDSFFRDVSELIKNLRRELGLDDDSDDDGGPQGNRDRVSYV